MKIKTITCHYVFNYGASLQAYALYKYLKLIGNEVEVIDYRPGYLNDRYKFFAIQNPVWSKNIIRKIIYWILKTPGRILGLRRRNRFYRFTKKNIRLTEKTFRTNSELEIAKLKADLFICGSDQIWNTSFENGKDPAFYLDFIPDDIYKCSYAASFAVDHVSPEDSRTITPRINRLNKISVREESALRILKSMNIRDAEVVLDPVFLLNRNDWLNFTKVHKRKAKYILIYIFEEKQIYNAYIQQIAKEKNASIYSVNASRSMYAHKNFPNSGPIEFLNLLFHAEAVITNSFHAVAFSIIFKKEFYVFQRHGTNSRIQDFLSRIGLENRLLNIQKRNGILLPIDYLKVEEEIEALVNKSKDFLEEIFKEISV